ncbi:MAG: cyclic nucleotide-binding/CBS domain-containing protein [Nitrospirales bacterium]
MQRSMVSRTEKDVPLDRDIERLRSQLNVVKGYLRAEPSSEDLLEYDSTTVDLIGEVLGSSSPMIEAYEYATVGEAAGLMNWPDEAPEGMTHESERENIRQRLRILESCVSDLEARRAAATQGARRKNTSGPSVAEYMSSSIQSISMDATLQEAGQSFTQWKIGSLLVQSGDEFVGYITETELTREVVGGGLDASTTKVETCMREPVITIESSDAIVEAVRLMKEKATRHLAVTESGRVIGVVSVSDVLRYYSGVS